jgi:(p)ppGpp synthase/HD superfamily hydrolase
MTRPTEEEALHAELMSGLEKAIAVAAAAHAGQVDKAGEPYILHPIRVMLRLHGDDARIAGVLHDVVEDTEWTLDGLSEAGFSDVVVDAVESVTRREHETYEAFIARASKNPIGRRVKIADLEDNLDLDRIPNPTAEDHARIEKYRRALEQLRGDRL